LAGNNDIINLQSYKKKGAWNIGLILFGVVFIYLAVTVLTYLTKDRVAVYEVREGSILKDNAFSGIVIRQETVVRADSDGYVNYFTESGEKAAVGANICTLSPEKLETPEEVQENQEVSLTAEEWNNIALKAQAFNESYDSQNFKTAQNLKTEVSAIIQNNTAQNRATQLNTLLENGQTEGLSVCQAPDDGVIEYGIDGYEDLKLKDVDESYLSKEDYTRTEYTNNTEVKAGDPLYKLITSEEWTVVIKLTPELEKQYNEMYDADKQKYAQVKFTEDNQTLRAKLDIYNRGKDDAYGFLTFTSSMIRYADERFVDIELILEDESGLKIPKTSLTSKEFYVVPESYLTTGGASKENGVMRQTKSKNGNAATEFVAATVFYRDSVEGLVYLDKNVLKAGDILVMPDSGETTKVGDSRKLQGVYNINKGYAVFKQVNILCESEEYYIVEEGSSYGLSNYDRIALYGNSVQENDVVTQ